jgi:hypothetical protein
VTRKLRQDVDIDLAGHLAPDYGGGGGGPSKRSVLERAARGFSLRSSVVSVISPITTLDIQISSQEMDLCNIILMEVAFPGDIGLTETVNI